MRAKNYIDYFNYYNIYIYIYLIIYNYYFFKIILSYENINIETQNLIILISLFLTSTNAYN